jgi:hypothetical protein
MKCTLGSVFLAVTFVSYCSFALHAQNVDACTSKTYYHREPKALSSEVISTPFVVRDISGTITYNGGKPLEGAYIEMPTGTTTVVANQSSPRGQFTLSSLNVLGPFAWSAEASPGTYCFRVTRADFHSVVGMIVVSRNAPKGAIIAIDLKPGEGYRDTSPDEQLLPASSVGPFQVPNPKRYPQKYADVYMPVSLAAGRVRTPEFSVSKQQWYAIVLQFESPLPPLRMRCMTGATLGPLDAKDCEKDERVLQADWTVWEDGRIVRWGSIADNDGGTWGGKDMIIQVGGFGPEPGKKYVVQLHFTKDGSSLNIANPHLIVIPHRDMY